MHRLSTVLIGLSSRAESTLTPTWNFLLWEHSLEMILTTGQELLFQAVQHPSLISPSQTREKLLSQVTKPGEHALMEK